MQFYRENVGPLLDGDGHLTNKDTGKTEKFNAFFASVFNINDGLWYPRCPEPEDCDNGNDKLPDNPKRVGFAAPHGSTGMGA